MPIKISKALRDKLPQEQRSGIEGLLLQKSGGRCYLCESDLNLAADTIYADHDLPEDASGATDLDNLNLVHKPCNDFKKNNPTVKVRPFLKLQAFLQESYKYGDCLDHFGIVPRPVGFLDSGQSARFDFPDGSAVEVPVFAETNNEGTFRYVFLSAPRAAIYNDDECQPRTLKSHQLWAIYSDLQRNPLHEPPSCRLLREPEHSMARLVMFDGQHKTIANWLMNRGGVVVKVYLDLSREQAIRLVNSIQAKIKKLPLSAFELAAKMAEEWTDRFAKYTAGADSDTASEAGFLVWVNKDEKSRAKAAFVDALYQNVLRNEDLEFKSYIKGQGPDTVVEQLTETTFRNKVLRPLLHLEPLKEGLAVSNPLREREAEMLVKVLNMFVQKVFEPDAPGAALSDAQIQRAKRVFYQSSLHYLSGMLREIVAHIMVVEKSRAFFEKLPSAEQWTGIGKAIDRVLAHPVWVARFEISEKMKQVEAALTKNQDAEKAFKNVGLKLGYALGVDPTEPDFLT